MCFCIGLPSKNVFKVLRTTGQPRRNAQKSAVAEEGGDGVAAGEAANAKTQTQTQKSKATTPRHGRGIKAKPHRPPAEGNYGPAQATASLAPPPVGRALARFRHVLRDSHPPRRQPTRWGRVVGLKPDLPCHSGEGGGRWQRRTGWLLARLPELKATTKPKVKSNHPPPPAYPSTGGELKPNRTGHQRRGITAPPQQHAPLAGA